MVSLYLPRFDPAADYVAIRNFRLNGETLLRGADVDTSVLTVRKVEQLYTTRFIGLKGVDQVRDAQVVGRPRKPRPEGTNEAVTEAAAPVRSPDDPPTFEQRVADLVEAHSRTDLLKMAEGIELPKRPKPNKEVIAAAILKASDGAS